MADAPKIQSISPDALQRITRAVRWVERQGAALPGRAGQSDAYTESAPIINTSGYTIPLGGMVWTKDVAADETRYVGKRPAYPGVSQLLIAASAIAHGENGRGWGPSPIPRTVKVDSWATTNVGDSLTCWFNQFDAHVLEEGPLVVVKKLDSPYVEAVYHGRRTESVMIHRTWLPDHVDLRCYTLILSGNFRCTYKHPNRLGIGS